LRWFRKGLYTYDRISLSDTHVIAQLVQRLHILLPSFAHRDVFHNEAFVTPCAHRLYVELLLFGRNIQHRCAVFE
jgi:hypothetical protein